MPGATNVSFSQIQTDFPAAPGLAAAANPISLSEYYRGNSGDFYVPLGQATSGTDGVAIPNSGAAIRVGMFRNLTRTLTYTLFVASSFNEGVVATAYVDVVGVAQNTTLYWTINHITTAAADFSVTSGSFTTSVTTGGFNIGTIVADVTTEGAQTFTLQIRTGSTSGPIVATSGTITINDTSTTPTGAVLASGANTYYALSTGTTSSTTSFTFNSNGTASASGSDTTTFSNWWTAAPVTGIGNSYWIRATVTAGTGGSFTGTVGTWLQLNTARVWQLVNSTSNSLRTRTLTISIATDSAGSNIVATYTSCSLICDNNFA